MSKIKINFDLNERLKKAEKEIKNELDKLTQLHVSKIQKNSLKGLTYDDKNLKSYTETTKKIRGQAGLQVSPPNLTQTGAMLKALTSKMQNASRGSFRSKIFMQSFSTPNFRDRKNTTNTLEKARNVLKLGFDFFGISDKDIEKIRKRLQTILKQGMSK